MIDLTKYKLVQPTSISKHNKTMPMYDITVKDNHNFYVYLNEHTKILTHNCDGYHISSLIISFFHRWFPHLIEDKRLFRIITPLVACDYLKERKYFFTIDEYQEFAKNNKVSNLKYLKGLGSLSIDDWEFVMKQKTLFSIINDRSSDKFLDIVFGDDSKKRKKWLEGK